MGGLTFQAEAIGGDFLDFLTLADGSLGIAIGDAMGHGVSAALMIAQVCAYLRALALAERSIGRIVALANRRVSQDVPEGYFVTLLLAQLHPATGALAYASAGHPTAYVLDPNGEVRRTLPSTGPALGIAGPTRGDFPTGPPVVVGPGELILFLTDGILEALDTGRGHFGIDRALEVVRTRRREHPDVIVRALVDQVRVHAMNQPDDDMTAIVLKADVTH
jgi:serine phosphatase RsbU (regulator of sigma subunit)